MKQFTIGYIDHSAEAHGLYLGPSLEKLEGEFDLDHTDSAQCPAKNYNVMIDRCKTPYLILTHQDVSFSPDLLACINKTIAQRPNFGALGMVGVDGQHAYLWSRPERIASLDTLDCCFIVLRPALKFKFDDVLFDDLHQYVEDYCGQVGRGAGLGVYTILTYAAGLYPGETNSKKLVGDSFLAHHGYTFTKRGACWGTWREYNRRLQEKWHGIQVT